GWERADGHEAGIHESAPGQPAESGRVHVGVRLVLQVIEQVQQDERVRVLTVDLENPLHRVVPAAQHLPIGRGQIRSASQELVQHGLAVRQAALKREPVDDANRFTLAQLLPGIDGLEHELLQLPFESWAEREIYQGPLQFRASRYEGGKRRIAATAVHSPRLYLTSPPHRARPTCG